MAFSRHDPLRRKFLAGLGAVVCAVGLAGVTGAPAQASPPVSSPALASTGGTYVALTPNRFLDTRTGLGGSHGLHRNQTADLQIAGRGAVPASGVRAVVLNVTVTQPTALGHLTVYPSHVAMPTVSNLNFYAGKDISNLVTVPLGPDGRVELTSASPGLTQVLVDVQGYFRAGAASSAGAFSSLNPARVLDTRSHLGAPGTVPAHGTISVQVTGRGGIPTSGVSAVAVNVTVTGPTAGGNVTVYPAGIPRPAASNLNFVAGQTVANLVIVPVGAGGKINLINDSVGSTGLIGDVQGYFLAGAPSLPGSFRRLTPSRILDTRVGLGGTYRVAAGAQTNVHIEGFGGVPASGVSAVVVNVTAVAPSAHGDLAAYPTGVVTPNTSNLNFGAGQTVPNLVIVPVDSYGWITLTNNSIGSTDEIADVAGYFLGTGVLPTVIGPHSYGPFAMGMTAAQAKTAYPALNITGLGPNSCGNANTPGAGLVFNRGTGQLSFVNPLTPVQTANGIHLGDTVASVKARFPAVELFPTYPDMTLAVTPAAAEATEYSFTLNGPRGTDNQPLPNDTVRTMSLNREQRCFD